MNVPYTRAPHQGGPGIAGYDSPHAALLIDFDNVTMGMRSDLSRELKNLLSSDVIKGKVSVQRAYADWRRYPQYIVPLSEASVDLIFAPAYGSSKKNATDIRMAIDALELIFIRPEIGTYILLTGDSDFSSLVLKLKEYGKYVIGVGIQESSSDILVQNCDEYYSYTSLTGLTKTTELSRNSSDPWVLVKDAVAKMVKRGDVMRSDRLKQVMQEIDPAFDEGGIGFSKFSKFLTEASSRGLVDLKKLENGQYEVGPGQGKTTSSRSDEGRGRRDRGRGGRRGGRDRTSRSDESGSAADAPSEAASSESATTEDATVAPTAGASDGQAPSADPLQTAYATLTEALQALKEAGRPAVRDSDVKRKMLERHRSFDETELGFTKFSRFLAQAAEDGIISLATTEAGNVDVSLPESGRIASSIAQNSERPEVRTAPPTEPKERPASPVSPSSSSDDAVAHTVIDIVPEPNQGGQRLGPRRGSTRRRGEEDAQELLGGHGFGVTVAPRAPTPRTENAPQVQEAALQVQEIAPQVVAETLDVAHGSTVSNSDVDGAPSVAGLGLPSDPGAIVRYLTHRYKGVGEKTAETLVEKLGANLFATMQDDPDAISRIVPPKRAEQVLDAWRADYERRTATKGGSRG
ncbi:MAG: NYN domain-containing protein [Gemmatimonadetes bacterium]|nr:NYN domain-containing protein [Gemmatimonadota bacterium]